jgi:hypothetical protein
MRPHIITLSTTFLPGSSKDGVKGETFASYWAAEWPLTFQILTVDMSEISPCIVP